MSPIEQPESSNIWLAFMRAQAVPQPRARPDDALEDVLDAGADFTQVRFDPGASVRERLEVLTPAQLYRLREAALYARAEREAETERGRAVRDAAPDAACIAHAIMRAECGQLCALDGWIGAVLERRQLGFYMTRSNEEAMHERLWDFHAAQAALAHDLRDYQEALALARGAATQALSRAEDAGYALAAATAKAELSVLRRAADAVEHAFLSRWRAQRSLPEDTLVEQLPTAFRDALRSVDALLLVRRVAAAYGPDAAAAAVIEEARDEGLGPSVGDLHAVVGNALMRETLFAHYAPFVSFVELAARAVKDSESGVLDLPLAVRQAIYETSRLAHALNAVYDRYADVVKAALGAGVGTSPLHVDFDLRHPGAEAPEPPSPADGAGLDAQFEDMESLLRQGDRMFAAVEPLARATVERLRAAEPPLDRMQRNALLQRPAELERFGTLQASTRSLVDGLAFRPPADIVPGHHAGTLPVAAVAEVAQFFSAVRDPSDEAADRIRDAERFLALEPEASVMDLPRRFFVLSGPCDLPLPRVS